MGNAQDSSKIRKAAEAGDSSGLRKMMKGAKGGTHSALLNQTDSGGRSALHIASQNGHLETVQLLLEGGADPCLADSNDETAVTAAIQLNRLDILEALCRSKPSCLTAPPLPLVAAAESGHDKIVTFLLEMGADPSGREDNGKTPLVAAICKGHRSCAEVLLAAGANPNDGTIPPRVKSPLLAACSKLFGSADICKLLLDAGANPSTATADGWTALHQSCLDGCFKQIALLIENGAEPYQTNADGKDSFAIVKETYSASNAAGLVSLLNGEKIDMSEESAVWKQVSQQ